MTTKNTPPSLAIILRANDIEKTKELYQQLGLTFNSEKHGNGPEHFAATISKVILEIYPGTPSETQKNWKESGQVNFAIEINPETEFNTFKKEKIIREAETNIETNEQSLMIEDPNGCAIRIMQKIKNVSQN